MTQLTELVQYVLHGKRQSRLDDSWILTDEIDYVGVDQVFPIYPEQPFFLEEMNKRKLQGANVLEIGLGSGVLSIGALKAGARQVTALEINPRAKLFAGFNALLNGVEGGLHITDGDIDDIWSPVSEKMFDYIISNPPFVPTLPNAKNYLHSSGGGVLGMDFVEKILRQLDHHLTPQGHAQIVTSAPGDDKLPTVLIQLADSLLIGSTELVIDPLTFPFELLQRYLPEGFPADKINRQLREQGITHHYLCVLHYEKGAKSITTRLSDPHPAWDMPLTNS